MKCVSCRTRLGRSFYFFFVFEIAFFYFPDVGISSIASLYKRMAKGGG